MTSIHNQLTINYSEDFVIDPDTKRRYRPVGKPVRWNTLACKSETTLFRLVEGCSVYLCRGAVVSSDPGDYVGWQLCGSPYWGDENPLCQPLERIQASLR